MNGKSKVWALALLIAVLFLGGAAGAVVDRTLMGSHACTDREAGRAQGGQKHQSYLARLSAELDLTEEQQGRLETIVERHRETYSALWREIRPQFDTIQANLRREIRDALNDEQRAKYDELLKNQAEHRRPRRMDR